MESAYSTAPDPRGGTDWPSEQSFSNWAVYTAKLDKHEQHTDLLIYVYNSHIYANGRGMTVDSHAQTSSSINGLLH